MREGWKEVTLGEIIQIKHGYGFKGEYFSDIETENILLTPGNFNIGGGFKNDKLKYYSGPINESFVLKENDVIITMTDLSKMADTIGFSAKIPKQTSKNYLHNQRIGLVEIVDQNFDLNFIYWLLRTENYQRYIAGSAIGATVKHTSPSKIYSTKLIVPTNIETQRKIAAILSAYDDLIENNLKRIKLLEEMAQQTYYDFVNNDCVINSDSFLLKDIIEFHIGGGWGNDEKTGEFSESGYVIRGTDIDPLKIGNCTNIPYRFHKISNIKSRKLINGDIIFEVSGGSSYEGVAKSFLITDEVLNYFNHDVMCASFCKLIRLKDKSLSHYFYFFLQHLRTKKITEIYEKRSASNIVNYNWEAFLEYQKIKIPNKNDLGIFNNVVVKMLQVVQKLGSQNQRLREARNILLPRLMMGLVDVDNIANR